MPRKTRVGEKVSAHVPVENEGALVAFDLSRKRTLWSIALDTPTGFDWVDDGFIAINSMYGNRTLLLDDRAQATRSIAMHLMNDLHSLVSTPRGILITSSGVDGILELSASGAVVWSWIASEHGLDRTPNGRVRKVETGTDHRRHTISTEDQSTHCNSARLSQNDGRDVVVATLFHQGQIIQIDRSSLSTSVRAFGLRHPHSLRPYGTGWIVCDSRPGSVVILDDDLWVTDIVEDDFNWVQDAVPVPDENVVLIADANNARIVVWSMESGKKLDELKYPGEWKIYQMEIVPKDRELAVRAIGAKEHGR